MPRDETTKSPSPVNVWILKLPEVVIVPPVACINAFALSLLVESWTLIQPSVASTKTKVAVCPCVFKVASAAIPPILLEPFGEIVKLFGNGSAYYAPAQSAIEMAESYLKDKKRVIPCAALCEGEFGIDGYFIGVPTVIGSNGVEKILDFTLTKNEREDLVNTLEAVKKTVKDTGL